jgi:hypothetical protein
MAQLMALYALLKSVNDATKQSDPYFWPENGSMLSSKYCRLAVADE